MPTDKLFTGQQREGAAVYDYGARMYNTDLGRMPQPDPVVTDASDPQSYNSYSYAANNPANYTDPTGMFGAPFALGNSGGWRLDRKAAEHILKHPGARYGPPPTPSQCGAKCVPVRGKLYRVRSGISTLTRCLANLNTEGVLGENLATLRVKMIRYQGSLGVWSYVSPPKTEANGFLVWDLSSEPFIATSPSGDSIDVHAAFYNRNRKIGGFIPILNSNGVIYDVNFSLDEAGQGTITHDKRAFGRLSSLLRLSFEGDCVTRGMP